MNTDNACRPYSKPLQRFARQNSPSCPWSVPNHKQEKHNMPRRLAGYVGPLRLSRNSLCCFLPSALRAQVFWTQGSAPMSICEFSRTASRIPQRIPISCPIFVVSNAQADLSIPIIRVNLRLPPHPNRPNFHPTNTLRHLLPIRVENHTIAERPRLPSERFDGRNRIVPGAETQIRELRVRQFGCYVAGFEDFGRLGVVEETLEVGS